MLLQVSQPLWEREIKVDAKNCFNAADQLSAELNYGLQIGCLLSSMILAEHHSVLVKV